MNFRIGLDLDTILKMHPLIFNNAFPLESCKKKERETELLSVGFYSGDELAGYCVVIADSRKGILRPWVGGVLPSFRNQGYFTGFYMYLTEYAEKNGYRYVDANTDNYKPAMLRMLIKLGFDIVGVGETAYGDGCKIKFRYTVHAPVKLRISITDKCNLNCFFCHHEGIEACCGNEVSIPDMERLLIQAKKRNAAEITITGGEPFARPDIIDYILQYCSTWGKPPFIKVITNGILVKEKQMENISRYKGNLRFHVSLHALDAKTAECIYGKTYDVSRVENTLRLLGKYQIPFRINCTVLKGLNDNAGQMRDLIAYGVNHHANAVHFMELLVTKQQKELQGYYTDYEQINNALKEALSEYVVEKEEDTAKRHTYNIADHQNGRIAVSAYRLSCRAGCQNCSQENDITIGSDFRCYPCYLMADKTCGNALVSLNEAVSERERFLLQQDRQYANAHLYWGE
ncbi:MAG: radical SAM protein [Lachnospiraceae bacterium]|nr:radical SAM protein [Lachnospiraceae bacterium]